MNVSGRITGAELTLDTNIKTLSLGSLTFNFETILGICMAIFYCFKKLHEI